MSDQHAPPQMTVIPALPNFRLWRVDLSGIGHAEATIGWLIDERGWPFPITAAGPLSPYAGPTADDGDPCYILEEPTGRREVYGDIPPGLAARCAAHVALGQQQTLLDQQAEEMAAKRAAEDRAN